VANVRFDEMRKRLTAFEFPELFVEELGWSRPASRQVQAFAVREEQFTRREIAQLAGVRVFEIAGPDGGIPDAKGRAAVHKEISRLFHENLLIFIDAARTRSLWYWAKRQDQRVLPRDHFFFRGQSGDLFIGKLSQMVFDLSDFEEAGNPSVVEVASRLQKALDVERTTKRFYKEYDEQRLAFTDLIQGLPNDRLRHWYGSILLNRLMFVYFMQKKFFLDGGNDKYLQEKLAASQKRGKDRFYKQFLWPLFFEGFAKHEDDRDAAIRALLGTIPYLNGGLFLPHEVIEDLKKHPKLDVPDQAFENLFQLFGRYSWHLDDTPGGKDSEINPDVLGYIFEKYINQKAFGAYYTRPEITEYLCDRTINRLILDAVNTPGIPGAMKARDFHSVADLLIALDADLCRHLLHTVLPRLSLLDPACGSGAFLVSAMKTLITIYSAVIGRIKFLNDRNLTDWLAKVEHDHRNVAYCIKKAIITENLYGVDLMEEATEIARLRLFLALVASAHTVDDLEPLPNIDFNIQAGNSLIGVTHVNEKDFNQKATLLRKSYRELLTEKNRLLDTYRHATRQYKGSLKGLRAEIEERKHDAQAMLDEILLDQFRDLEIKFEEATWDEKKGEEGKSKKRTVALRDVQALKPFHWGYEFDDVVVKRGGFDAIITNPPWDIFKPNAKEFFEEYSDLVSKKKMSIHDFEKAKAKLMKDQEVRETWLAYQGGFPHVSAFYRKAPQYKNQISVVNGKKAGTDINLYKLFVEQCFNLLRPSGQCGIVIPSGIYTDLGAKQLREMLFGQTEITGMFGFENRKIIFENVDSRFKFVVLTYSKGGVTRTFPAAFMRHDVAELARFPDEGSIAIDIGMVRRLSPDSLSVMEFKNDRDAVIAEKLLKFPLLGENVPGTWKLSLTREFDMTNDSGLFKTAPAKGRLPLYEGKMVHHFDHRFCDPRFWIDEREGRQSILGRTSDSGQSLDYQTYRLGFRDVARNTDERTLIAALLPKGVFSGNTLITSTQPKDIAQTILCIALLDSFSADYAIRQKVSAHCNMFYVYQMPIPRLTRKDPAFASIVERAARLICTTPEFDDLAKEVGLGSHKKGATEKAERARLRAELDGLIAHLYGLTEDEFAYILTTFPLVPDPVRLAAQNAYRDVERGLVR
jgi:hypothetical protein